MEFVCEPARDEALEYGDEARHNRFRTDSLYRGHRPVEAFSFPGG